MAASYISGLQSKGVAATIKHFVGNDQEDERTAADSVVSERALREVYLYPFVSLPKYPQPFMLQRCELCQIHDGSAKSEAMGVYDILRTGRWRPCG